MEFKHFYCHCNNIDVNGKVVDLHHKTALNNKSLKEIIRNQQNFPLLQINSSSIYIKDWKKISINKISSSKFQLVCCLCSQSINIYPIRSNCYLQFGKNIISKKRTDLIIPPEIHEIFNIKNETISPTLLSIDKQKKTESGIFSLEQEMLMDDNDFELMFGNHSERFVGSFQDYLFCQPL